MNERLGEIVEETTKHEVCPSTREMQSVQYLPARSSTVPETLNFVDKSSQFLDECNGNLSASPFTSSSEMTSSSSADDENHPQDILQFNNNQSSEKTLKAPLKGISFSLDPNCLFSAGHLDLNISSL